VINNSISFDDTIDNYSGSGNATNTTVNFVDLANNDLRLTGNNPAAINHGQDLSANPNIAFATDIQGETRTVPWDIGADEYASGASSLTFSLSANAFSFGHFDTEEARYASSTTGSVSETKAHTISVSTNASSGYALTVRGATLTNNSYTISAIGETKASSTPGTAQFGLRLTASGGSGVINSPYNGSTGSYAYNATAESPSVIASESAGDGVETVYNVYYLANISNITPPGDYSTMLTYVVTGNF
jgi:hypothetical protein